jgi:hypothetical protein
MPGARPDAGGIDLDHRDRRPPVRHGVAFMLSVCGKPIERALHRRWLDKPADEQRAITLHDE